LSFILPPLAPFTLVTRDGRAKSAALRPARAGDTLVPMLNGLKVLFEALPLRQAA
jgi:hypothetical protein